MEHDTEVFASSRRSLRPASLVRIEAGLADVIEPGSSAGATLPVNSPLEAAALPNQVRTPNAGLPSRAANLSNASLNSAVSAGGSKGKVIDYKFTLPELNQRAYFLVHNDDPSRDYTHPRHTVGQHPLQGAFATTPPELRQLKELLATAVVLANLEVVLIRNVQLAGASAAARVDLASPCPSKDTPNIAELNRQALQPAEAVLFKRGTEVRLDQLFKRLIKQEGAIKEHLRKCGEAIRSCDKRTLETLCNYFAGYMPAALDESKKKAGGASPYDPHTNNIDKVDKIVTEEASGLDAEGPDVLCRLAVELVAAVVRHRPSQKHTVAALLLQRACQTGHVELVHRLLADCAEPAGWMTENTVVRCLTRAWMGYQGYSANLGYVVHELEPLQPGRAREHTMDWLDFKCSCARAMLIAHQVLKVLIASHTDSGLAASAALAASGNGALRHLTAAPTVAGFSAAAAAAIAMRAVAAEQLGRGDHADHLPPIHAHYPTRQHHQQHAGASVRFDVSAAAGTRPTGAGPAAGAGGPGGDTGGAAPPTEEHTELTDKKWSGVQVLFSRAAACKPLSLAMMHVVLAGKRSIRKKLKEERDRAKAAPSNSRRRQRRGSAGGGGLDGGGSELDVDGNPVAGVAGETSSAYMDDTDAEDERADERAEQEERRKREEEETGRYRALHRLAVQACHLAVHSTSLSTVSDAIACIRAVRAWPCVDLHMLNDLARSFPQEAAALLGMVPLEPVDLEDNVLPFGLPPGFVTVAVSDKDSREFREEGGSGSTQDAEHFSTQRDEDVSIQASLLVLARTWLALFLLFWPHDFKSPTTAQMMRVMGCCLAAFAVQGPGSCVVALAAALLLAIVGFATRVIVAVIRILYWGVLFRLWSMVAGRFPVLRMLWDRILGRDAGGGPVSRKGLKASKVASTVTREHTVPPVARNPGLSVRGDAGSVKLGGWEAAGSEEGEGEGEEEEAGREAEMGRLQLLASRLGLPAALGSGIWKRLFARGHNTIIDAAVGWGRGSASISCRKVPMPVLYAAPDDRGRAAVGPSGPRRRQQLDTALLERLLHSPGVHPSVFGSRVLRAFILFKWNYFTRYFIILQFLLHVCYMGVFIAYAFSIRTMEPVDGRESGVGSSVPGCQLAAPTRTQTALLVVLAVMTVDFVVQELRQIRHFGLRFFTHPWDLLDVTSVALVVASIALHVGCSSGASPLTLRGLAASQIVLLFMRLLYYAMASDKLGSFVRMVLETTYDLLLFFVFLSVVFVGFALAIVVAQGSLADIKQTFIKLFTMMYGDFDVDFLTNIDSGALGLDELTQVLVSIYMIMVTIILLNLLISIISESYERIRENERWESLRNKALLIVESETQLYQFFLAWLYRTLTPPSAPAHGEEPRQDKGKRFLYIIAPEYARRGTGGAEQDDDDLGDDDDEEEEADGDEDEGADGQWNGRLGEIKRHITVQNRALLETVRKEMHKVMSALEEQQQQLQKKQQEEKGELEGQRAKGGAKEGSYSDEDEVSGHVVRTGTNIMQDSGQGQTRTAQPVPPARTSGPLSGEGSPAWDGSRRGQALGPRVSADGEAPQQQPPPPAQQQQQQELMGVAKAVRGRVGLPPVAPIAQHAVSSLQGAQALQAERSVGTLDTVAELGAGVAPSGESVGSLRGVAPGPAS